MKAIKLKGWIRCSQMCADEGRTAMAAHHDCCLVMLIEAVVAHSLGATPT